MLDLFESRHNAQLPKYVSWKQDPFSVGIDAFQRSWRVDGLNLFPPFAMIPRCLQKNTAGTGNSDINCPSVTITALDPEVAVSLGKASDLASTIQGSVNISHSELSPLVGSSKVPACSMETVRGQNNDLGVSEDAAKLLSEYSWRGGTTRAYNSSWGQWSSWCSGKQIDPFRSSLDCELSYRKVPQGRQLQNTELTQVCYLRLSSHD